MLRTSVLNIRCFGSFSARVGGGGALSFPTRRSRALLAFLAAEGDGWHSRDELASLLWPDSEDEAARRSLRQELSTLRGVIGDEHLEADGDRVRLCPRRVTCDARAFDAAAHDVGTFLADAGAIAEPFDNWVRERRRRFQEQIVAALDEALAHARKDGRNPEAIDAARRLVAIEPTREAAHRELMELLAATGQPAAAMQQFRACVAALRRDLQVAPSAETRAVYDAIRATHRTSRRRVLVVDDNPVTRVQLEALLTAERYEVRLAEHGAHALLDIGAEGVDLVVTDVDMPMLDGLRLLEVLRSRTGQAPVLVITGVRGAAVERQARELGAVGFLRKPIDARALMLAVRKALAGERTA